MKGFLIAVAAALVLAFGAGPDEQSAPAPAPAPAPAVPLAISETTRPPGWTPPAPEPEKTVEQELGEWLTAVGLAARWQAVAGVVTLVCLIAMVIGLEKSRSGGHG